MLFGKSFADSACSINVLKDSGMTFKFSMLVVCCLAILSPCYGQDVVQRDKSQTAERSGAKPLGKAATELGTKVMVIFQDSNQHYWFGGGQEGVYRYDGKDLVLFSNRDGLCSHSIVGIQEDGKGNIYFDTTEGISKFDGRSFQTLQPVKSQSSSNGWRLKPSDLWFRMGWDKNGPYRYDGEVLYELEFSPVERAAEFHAKFPNADWSPYGIYTLYQDSKGVVWFGTAALGVCRYDGESISWLYEQHLTQTPNGGDFGIRSIIEDKDGVFWFCNSQFRYEVSSEVTENAQVKYQRKAGVGVTKINGEVEFPYFMSVASDENGNLWMATYDDGVWRYDGEKLVHYPVKVGNRNVLLFSIYKDQQGTLWLGTHNRGVFKFNGTEFEPFLNGR